MTAEKGKRSAKGRQGKYLQIALVVAASAAWLTYAVLVWQQRAGRLGDGSWADRLCGLFSNKGGVTTCMIYLSLSGFIFFAYLLTNLLPAFLVKLSPKRDRLPAGYRIPAAVLLLIAAVASVVCNLSSVMRPVKQWLGKAFGTETKTAVFAFLQRIFTGLTPVSLVLIVLVLLASLFLFARGGGSGRKTVPDIKRTVLLYGLLIVLGFLITCLSASLLAITGHFSRSAVTVAYDNGLYSAKQDSMFFAMVVLAPFIEEPAFRSVIQHLAQKVLPGWAAVLFAALMFGIWHRNIGQIIYTMVMGIIWGIVYLRTGKLRHTLLLHVLQNLLTAMSFSMTKDALLGRIGFAVSIREWLYEMNLVPAVITFLIIGALIAVAEYGVIRITKK